MPPVASSAIASIDWSPSQPITNFPKNFVTGQFNLLNALLRGTLEVEFANPTRGTWEYINVPALVWIEFKSAGSIGKYFNNHIRGVYPSSRVG